MFFATTLPYVVRRATILHDPSALRRATAAAPRRTHAGAELTEEADNYTLRLDTPGVSREQLTIGIEGQRVRIESVDGAPRRYAQVLDLPADVDVAGSQARLENGVLTVRLAKKAASAPARSIQIN